MILIYTERTTNRITYACQVIFTHILKAEWRITTAVADIRDHQGVTMAYGACEFETDVQIPAGKFLLEKTIDDIEPDTGDWNGLKTLFPMLGGIPFDLLSATFYLVSRYEEYLPYKADSQGRFQAEESFAFKNGFLADPIIDQWALALKEQIQRSKPKERFGQRKFQHISTVDIDSAYAYRYKGFMRTLGGFAKDVVAFDLKNARKRLSTIMGLAPDQYDTYDEMIKLHQEYQVSGVFFFLLADYGHNDKNVPHTSDRYRLTIKRLADYFDIGVHPGYMSNTEPEKISQEISRLADISKVDVVNSRQHFLMVSMPQTYQRLLENDIEHDYSMGFASQLGFRMSTCSAVPWYNLKTEQITSLMLHPFPVMDATLNMYLNLSPQDAVKAVEALIEKVRAVDGTFISLWHNESLSDVWKWKGWKNVLKEIILLTSSKTKLS
jgi:hypothetical protein